MAVSMCHMCEARVAGSAMMVLEACVQLLAAADACRWGCQCGVASDVGVVEVAVSMLRRGRADVQGRSVVMLRCVVEGWCWAGAAWMPACSMGSARPACHSPQLP